ncbi:hypothetical protein BHM03_00024943 [Ensete ventricosum]|nr:hypothetical protein BHM03_00024943 [Ensete ventricosum]
MLQWKSLLCPSPLSVSAGKAAGVLYEDDGDGYGYTQGNYLLTYYTAEIDSSVLTVKVLKSEGSWKRPQRALHVKLLLGGGVVVNFIDAQGVDGEELHFKIPSKSEVFKLVAASENKYTKHMGSILSLKVH